MYPSWRGISLLVYFVPLCYSSLLTPVVIYSCHNFHNYHIIALIQYFIYQLFRMPVIILYLLCLLHQRCPTGRGISLLLYYLPRSYLTPILQYCLTSELKRHLCAQYSRLYPTGLYCNRFYRGNPLLCLWPTLCSTVICYLVYSLRYLTLLFCFIYFVFSPLCQVFGTPVIICSCVLSEEAHHSSHIFTTFCVTAFPIIKS